MSKFNIGDELYYINEIAGREKYKCIVTDIEPTTRNPIVTFYAKKTWACYKIGYKFGTYNFPDSVYELAINKFTKEERVLNKCKRLWNNSNYVKNSPIRSY